MRRLIFLAALVISMACNTAFALDGTYKIEKGLAQDGSPYTGTVVIKKTGEIYSVSWLLDGSGAQYQGIGVLQGDTLSVAWGGAGAIGVVSYKVAGASLDGLWTVAGSIKTGKETLTRK